jgi:hypothetical protein
MVEGEEPKSERRSTDQRKEDIIFCTDVLKSEKLTQQISGRYHKSFPSLSSCIIINKAKSLARVRALSKKLDKAKRVVV